MAMDPELVEELRLERSRKRQAQYAADVALSEEITARLGEPPTVAPVVVSVGRLLDRGK